MCTCLQNYTLPIFGHLVTLIFDPQIFSNAAPITLFHWQNWHLVHLNGVIDPKLVILPIFGHVGSLAFDRWTSNFQKCLIRPPLSLSDRQQFISGIVDRSCGSKAVLLPRCGYVVTLMFNLWTSNSQKCSTLPQQVFFWWTKAPTCYIWMEFWLQNWLFAYKWSGWTLIFDLLISNFQKCLKLLQ